MNHDERSESSFESPALRWWQLPSCLGLDAPVVVTTWTWLVAVSTGVPLAPKAATMLFLTVWSIYLLDRIIDVRKCLDWTSVPGRMLFGRIHLRLFVILLMASVCGLLVCFLLGEKDWAFFRRGLIVASAWIAYFLVFVCPVGRRCRLPGKEFAVGIFFGLGCYAALGNLASIAGGMTGIAMVVTYNCLVIAAKDVDADRKNDAGGAGQWWPKIERDLKSGGFLILIVVAAFWVGLRGDPAGWICGAALFSIAGLMALHWNAWRFSADSIRALADYAILFPPAAFLAA